MNPHLARTHPPPVVASRAGGSTLAVLAVVLLSLPACKDDVLGPAGEPDDAGRVVAVGKDIGPGDPDRQGLLTRIHVKTNPADANECGVIYDVFDETGPVDTTVRIRASDGRVRPADVSTLSVGDRVRVWHTGAIAESCPAQGVATTVEIVEE